MAFLSSSGSQTSFQLSVQGKSLSSSIGSTSSLLADMPAPPAPAAAPGATTAAAKPQRAARPVSAPAAGRRPNTAGKANLQELRNLVVSKASLRHRTVREAFMHVQRNGRGLLEREELRRLFRVWNMTPEQADRFFDAVDVSGRGEIDPEFLRRMLNEHEQGHHRCETPASAPSPTENHQAEISRISAAIGHRAHQRYETAKDVFRAIARDCTINKADLKNFSSTLGLPSALTDHLFSVLGKDTIDYATFMETIGTHVRGGYNQTEEVMAVPQEGAPRKRRPATAPRVRTQPGVGEDFSYMMSCPAGLYCALPAEMRGKKPGPPRIPAVEVVPGEDPPPIPQLMETSLRNKASVYAREALCWSNAAGRGERVMPPEVSELTPSEASVPVPSPPQTPPPAVSQQRKPSGGAQRPMSGRRPGSARPGGGGGRPLSARAGSLGTPSTRPSTPLAPQAAEFMAPGAERTPAKTSANASAPKQGEASVLCGSAAKCVAAARAAHRRSTRSPGRPGRGGAPRTRPRAASVHSSASARPGVTCSAEVQRLNAALRGEVSVL